MEEIWKEIIAIHRGRGGRIFYPEGYEVSNLGRVRTWRQRYGKVASGSKRQRLKEPVVISGRSDGNGYISYCLYDGTSKRLNIRGHVLVMQTFIGLPDDGQVICHFDDNKRNNSLSNLRYDSQKENMNDLKRNKRHQ